jgi:type II restriction enzyme
MRYLEFYNQNLDCSNEDEVFNYLITSLKPSILAWSYFVNWEKVFTNTKKIEIALNNLNYLIGKDNFDDEFRLLIKNNPSLAKTIPALVVRDGKNNLDFKILVDYKNKKFVYEDYNFSKKVVSDSDIERYLCFVKESGLKDLIKSQKIKNLVDYMIGVEAGLDSNGRKNRGGKAMENVVEFFINDVCILMGFKYLKEANAKKVKNAWDIDIPVDKSSRRYDFVINANGALFVFEANFYGGGGTKLKSTAGEYKKLFDVSKGSFKFIWITDGLGWKTAKKSLGEAFTHNDYIINLSMLEKGILKSICKNN